MSFIAQDFEKLDIITVLEGRTQAVIRDHFLKYDRAVRCRVKIITMDMFSPYYDLARQLFPCAKIVLDRFHIVQHLSRAMSRVRVQIMNQFHRKSHEYKAIKRYWKLIQQDSRKLLIEKISMTDIAHQLSISTSTVIRKLNDFHFECNFRNLPKIMSWDVETVRGVTVSIGRWR
ncbi:transposase [Streptococcus pneumoniae]|nr:transposase [Streptococcus pneumoniae]